MQCNLHDTISTRQLTQHIYRDGICNTMRLKTHRVKKNTLKFNNQPNLMRIQKEIQVTTDKLFKWTICWGRRWEITTVEGAGAGEDTEHWELSPMILVYVRTPTLVWNTEPTLYWGPSIAFQKIILMLSNIELMCFSEGSKSPPSNRVGSGPPRSRETLKPRAKVWYPLLSIVKIYLVLTTLVCMFVLSYCVANLWQGTHDWPCCRLI